MKISFCLFIVLVFLSFGCQMGSNELEQKVISLDEERVLEQAENYMDAPIRTITDAPSERSAGGLQNFYSEGDYWWPDTSKTEGM